MMRIFLNFKILILIGFLLFVIFVIIWLSISTNNIEQSPSPTPSPIVKANSSPSSSIKISDTRIDAYDQEYLDKNKVAIDKQKTIADQQTAVGNLLSKLPYKGTNFRLEFTFKTNDFIVTINKANQKQGQQEFEQFLKDNGVESSDWITNLVIKYE